MSTKRRALRREVLLFDRDDGGVDALDLLFERLVTLSRAEIEGVRADPQDPGVIAHLDSLLLLESPIVDNMRHQTWASKARGIPRPAPSEVVPEVDWGLAREWPSLVAPRWREPESLRRLAEARAAGQRYLHLDGFVAPEAARALADEVRALPWQRLETEVVRGDRHLLGEGELTAWQSLMGSATTRTLLGAVLGVQLPATTTINAWRLGAGDWFAAHPDGRNYVGTLGLGLCEGWTATDGGAIAFGVPGAKGFAARQRWLPHLGDALLFSPAQDSWHVVEPVQTDRGRLTLTGWWTR